MGKTVELFEALADATWQRLRFAELLRCSQGEETISDINLLELIRRQFGNIQVFKFSRSDESKTGLDWEWWIYSRNRGCRRYAVQAKKLSPQHTYGIRHKVRQYYQIDLLEQYSRINKCIPLYCFYNSFTNDTVNLSAYWHCDRLYDKTQLGCTVAPINVVREAFSRRGYKTFNHIHRHKSVIPWRCLIECQHVIDNPIYGGTVSETGLYPELPSFLRPESDGAITFDVDGEIPDSIRRYYSDDVRFWDSIVYPRRVLAVSVDS